MKQLKKEFKRRGLNYKIIVRNNTLAIYGVSGSYTDKILHYEVMMIRLRNDQYGLRESIPSDEEFGKSKPDRHFQSVDQALSYFDVLTSKLMQEVKEEVDWVEMYRSKEIITILD